MLKVDHKSKCTIFSGSFFDDIQKYELIENNNILSLNFSGTIFPVNFNITGLSSVIQNSQSIVSQFSTLKDVWIPIIIDNDNHVLSKEIRQNFSIKKKIFGIENMVQFRGLFNNWNVTNTNIKLNCNWFINSNDIAYVVDYGLLCWYKNNSNYIDNQFKELKDLPNGSKIYCAMSLTAQLSDTESISISPTDLLIKHSDTSLIIVDKDDSKFLNTSDASSRSANIQFNYERKLFNLSKVNNIDNLKPKFKLAINPIDSENIVLKNASLWISNGEAYSYSLNNNRRAENYTLNMSSLSYLSPSLFPIYNAIYHRLTCRLSKPKGTSGLNAAKLSMLKKLCYFLSTAPLMDRTTVDILYHEEISGIVDTMLATAISSQIIEKETVITALIKIMQKFESLSFQIRTYSNLSTNIINNKKDLFNKLTNKYWPHILINQVTDIAYKHNINYGPNISVRRNIRTICPKTLANTSSGVDGIWQNAAYNNEIIKCHGLKIQTNFSPSSSEIILSQPDEILPTADIIRSPLAGNLRSLDLGPAIKVTLNVNAEETEFFVSCDPIGIGSNSNFRELVYWELVEGPDCLRFSNCTLKEDLTIFGGCAYQRRYLTSQDHEPKIFVKSRGLYKLKATINYGADKQTDILQIYVVDNTGQYGPNLYPPESTRLARQGGSTTDPVNYSGESGFASNAFSSDNLKCLCLNMSQFAISKTNGLFWPIKTDSYVVMDGMDAVFGSTAEFDIPGMIRLQENIYSKVKTNDTDTRLTFSFIPNTTQIVLDNIYLEHMRSSHPDCAQCSSFYQDTLGKTIKTSSQRTYGTAGFDRRKKFSDGLTVKKFLPSDEILSGNVTRRTDTYSIMYPHVSLTNAPRIKSYGGYDSSTLKNLGINNIPGHTAVSGELPVLPRRHFFGYPSNIYCHFKPLIINSDANILFDKGVFHPALGWICSPNSSDAGLASFSNGSIYTQEIANKDSSFKFNTDKLDTLIFKGKGIYNLGSSIKVTSNDKIIDLSNAKTSSIYLYSANDNPEAQAAKASQHKVNYGYRTLTSPGALIDEYYNDIEDTPQTSLEYKCDNTANNVSYAIDRLDIDNLFIESLEIKINNLNYPNSKHIVAWIEVINNSMQTPANKIETNFLNISDITNSSIQSYMTALKNMNADTNNKRTLYLLNRDSIDNYMYNFSIKFSDNTKNIAGVNYSSIPISSTANRENIDYTESLFSSAPRSSMNNETIKPTLTANGFNDIQATAFKEAIIKNKLYDQNNMLAKFNGIPLKNTRFILYVGICDINDNFFISDMTHLNNALLGVSSVTERQKPNILSNAFCSWDLIIHTKKNERPIPCDPIGIFDRKSDNPVFNRCNFIANFANKKHLIPQANLNAPYSYIDNTNICKYDQEELSTFTRFNTVEFPSWAIIQIIAAMTPFYAGGGFVFTGDPSIGYNAIYEYFGDIRLEAQTELQAQKVQTGRYTKEGFGNPDKALINISQDGDTWYKLEVPIYRYSNSTILKKNKYQYIKISNNRMPFLSRIAYEPFTDSDIETLPTKEQIELTNYSNYFWRKNNIVKLSNIPTKEYVKENKKRIFKVRGERAYYLFDIDESVFVSDPTEENPNAGFSAQIEAKGILTIKDVLYTVLYFGSDINVTTYISKENNDTIVIFKNDHTTIGDNNPLNKWGLEKSPKMQDIPDRHFNTLGEGSYGRGTEYIQESVFTYLEDENKIEPIYNIINHRINPGYKFNKLTINPDSDDELVIDPPSINATASSTIRGYPWCLTENQKLLLKNYILKGEISNSLTEKLKKLEEEKEVVNDDSTLNESDKRTRLKNIDKKIPMSDVLKMSIPDLKAYISFIEPDLPDCSEKNDCLMGPVQKILEKRERELSIFYESNHEYTFMDIKCSFLSNVPDSGEVIIENDWIIDQPKNKLSSTDISSISNRINFLRNKTQAFEQELKTAKQNSQFPKNISLVRLQELSIPDLITYLNALDGHPDGVSCYSRGFSFDNCRQAFTNKIIDERRDELSELQNAIETNNRYSDGVLPIVERKVIVQAYGVLSIKESLNLDYYWITIDPEQECSWSMNMTSKVLSKANYNCVANKANNKGIGVFTSDVRQVCPDNSMTINGPDIIAEVSPGSLTVTNLKAQQEKNNYPNVRSWKTFGIDYSGSGSVGVQSATKYIWINGGANGDNDYAQLDSLVAIGEVFEIPENTNTNMGIKVKDVIDIKSLNTIKIRFGNIPRKVKEYDKSYKRYTPNIWGKLGKAQISIGAGGPTWASFDYWSCFNEMGSTLSVLPDQYKLMNEMLFRSYYGSVDGIEHKNSILSDTKQSWEWIPYEYDLRQEATTNP